MVFHKKGKSNYIWHQSTKEIHFSFGFKKSIKELKAFENVGEAINDLIYKNEDIDNHICLNHKEIVVERYKLIKEGGKLPKPELLPEKIRRKKLWQYLSKIA